MKAAYLAIFASLLAFPLTFALVEHQAARHCPANQPCLPREIHLTASQQDSLRGVYERKQRQQEALERQTRHALLALLTPEQRQQLRRRDPQFERAHADRAHPERTGPEALPQAQR